MTTRKEPDPEGDKADSASLEDAGEACSFCGGPLDLDGECADPACPGSSPDDDDDEVDEEPDPDA